MRSLGLPPVHCDCPDMYWRSDPNVELAETEFERRARFAAKTNDDQASDDIASAMNFLRKHAACTGTVGVIGYCWGGYLAISRRSATSPMRRWVITAWASTRAGSGEESFLPHHVPLRGTGSIRVTGSRRAGSRDVQGRSSRHRVGISESRPCLRATRRRPFRTHSGRLGGHAHTVIHGGHMFGQQR